MLLNMASRKGETGL